MNFLTFLATNDGEFEKLNDDLRPAPFSLQIYQTIQDKIKDPNQSKNFNEGYSVIFWEKIMMILERIENRVETELKQSK